MIQYVANGPLQEGITLSGFAQMAQAGLHGPTPWMGRGEPVTKLDQRKRGVINLGLGNAQLVAYPLLTCAAVILASTDQTAPARAAVYHALSGSISDGTLDAMRTSLGKPAKNSLVVAYVVTKPWDNGYHDAAMGIEKWGVPQDQVIYMANLRGNQFGINAHGQIGV